MPVQMVSFILCLNELSNIFQAGSASASAGNSTAPAARGLAPATLPFPVKAREADEPVGLVNSAKFRRAAFEVDEAEDEE